MLGGLRPRRALTRLTAVTAGVLVAAAMTAQPASAAAPPKNAVAPNGSRVVAEKKVAKSRAVDLTVASKAMRRNMPVRVLLPRGWKATAKRTWPVVLLLHGGADNYTSWTKKSDIAKFTEKDGVIIVMAEAGRAGNYTNWHNYGKGGPPAWETFHLREVLPIIERAYRGSTTRAIVGNSMGGYGAAAYTARNPGMFRHMASFSGIVATQLPFVPAIIMKAQKQEKTDPYAMWGYPRVNKSVWDAHDPLHLAANFRGTKLYFSSGTTSLRGELDPPNQKWHPASLGEPTSAYTIRALTAKLKSLGIPATVNLYGNGSHSWPYWQRELHRVWPSIMKTLGASRASAAQEAPADDSAGWNLLPKVPDLRDTPIAPRLGGGDRPKDEDQNDENQNDEGRKDEGRKDGPREDGDLRDRLPLPDIF
ncbi:alpha/beta hydrolase [Bailinhaonella thermotolerans]|uniref:alpha/beta hydrolase n=1 Tax=Bailinhaonella thermotolerans TaxID=1070861 RepID=UPI00192A34F2|nr:alpha/beta hydrolase family protein [Bailinhaonella thermotolerans]